MSDKRLARVAETIAILRLAFICHEEMNEDLRSILHEAIAYLHAVDKEFHELKLKSK